MSRVAKAPVVVPASIDVKINGQVITIKGKNGGLASFYSDDAVEVKHADNTLTFGPRDGYADGWAQAGTARALLNSMVIGVTEGFTKKLQLVGVGYRAAVKGNVINLLWVSLILLTISCLRVSLLNVRLRLKSC